MKYRLCILITCFNRRDKTLECLRNLFKSDFLFFEVEIYLLDDGSKDGTKNAVKNEFPKVKIFEGDGSYFWAGGMRFIWNRALVNNYDYYLLLNDDTNVSKNVFSQLAECHNYSLAKYKQTGIYIGNTKDTKSKKFTYGGRKFLNPITPHFKIVYPNQTNPQIIDLGNANIMLIHRDVVDKIGIFSSKFTHGIADYEYTYRARKNKIPVLITTDYCGICDDDHGDNWRSSNYYPLKRRISYLFSNKGLSFKEYLLYIAQIRPLYLPVSFILLWIKTFFPFIWDSFKTNKS